MVASSLSFARGLVGTGVPRASRSAARARARSAVSRAVRAEGAKPFDGMSGLTLDDVVSVGVAQCFEKTESGKVEGILVAEPLSSATVECLNRGADTSYKACTTVRLGAALKRDLPDLLALFDEEVKFCDDFDFRTQCAARTWLTYRAQTELLDIIPLGAIRQGDLGEFSVKHRRILNLVHEVSDEDNIKQDMSIDVYGRAEEEEGEEEEKTAAAIASEETGEAAAVEEEEEEDDLDALLAG